jgi:ABC-type dipeptide/oligopeptide/nickel transport system permease subunit
VALGGLTVAPDLAATSIDASNWPLIWWMRAGPGIAIFLAVLAFNFLGDALRDALDPHIQRRA